MKCPRCGQEAFDFSGGAHLCPACSKKKRIRERANSRHVERYATEEAYRAKHIAKGRREYWKVRDDPGKYSKKLLSQRAWRFGTSVEQLCALMVGQDSKCGICRRAIAFGGPAGAHIDHDHRLPEKHPQAIRGILCHLCNLRLGYSKENRDLLSTRELKYLQGWERGLTCETTLDLYAEEVRRIGCRVEPLPDSDWPPDLDARIAAHWRRRSREVASRLHETFWDPKTGLA